MIETCCGWADAQGVNIAKLAVVTTNASAIRCYERCGSQSMERSRARYITKVNITMSC